MKVLVVGGTGLLGGHAALHLQGLGHDVTLAARSPAHPETTLAAAALPRRRLCRGGFPGRTARRLRLVAVRRRQ